jgi:hypothetical protein
VRTDRHIVEYQCDQCGARVVAYDKEHEPASIVDTRPDGWLTVDPRGKPGVAHLCSAACLQAWAGKQGASQ